MRKRKHLRRMALVSIQAALLALVPTAPSNASIFTGSCVLNVSFGFSGSISSPTAAPSYAVSISPAADLDPLWSGSQPCVISGDTSPARTTTGGGGGSSTIWSCEGVVASGEWDQSWHNRSGASDPASVNGRHTITGTWDNWEMVINTFDLRFAGTIHLTLSPNENRKLNDCTTGHSITSLEMVGVMVFQDPELP